MRNAPPALSSVLEPSQKQNVQSSSFVFSHQRYRKDLHRCLFLKYSRLFLKNKYSKGDLRIRGKVVFSEADEKVYPVGRIQGKGGGFPLLTRVSILRRVRVCEVCVFLENLFLAHLAVRIDLWSCRNIVPVSEVSLIL